MFIGSVPGAFLAIQPPKGAVFFLAVAALEGIDAIIFFLIIGRYLLRLLRCKSLNVVRKILGGIDRLCAVGDGSLRIGRIVGVFAVGKIAVMVAIGAVVGFAFLVVKGVKPFLHALVIGRRVRVILRDELRRGMVARSEAGCTGSASPATAPVSSLGYQAASPRSFEP